MRVTILLCLLLPVLIASAQIDTTGSSAAGDSTSRKHWKRGFSISLTGDTLYGKIKIMAFFADIYYDPIGRIYFEDKAGKVSRYGPGKIKSFSFYDDRDSSHWVTYSSIDAPSSLMPAYAGGPIFARLYIDGVCKVYGYRVGGSNGIYSEMECIQAKNSDVFPLRMIGFKKTMKEFFAGCPLIVCRLNNNTYNWNNWETLISDYNHGICK